jgi:hypothetical protein
LFVCFAATDLATKNKDPESTVALPASLAFIGVHSRSFAVKIFEYRGDLHTIVLRNWYRSARRGCGPSAYGCTHTFPTQNRQPRDLQRLKLSRFRVRTAVRETLHPHWRRWTTVRSGKRPPDARVQPYAARVTFPQASNTPKTRAYGCTHPFCNQAAFDISVSRTSVVSFQACRGVSKGHDARGPVTSLTYYVLRL